MARLTVFRRRSRREWLATVLVLGGLVACVLLVYGVVVVIGGAVLGLGQTNAGLSIVATALVALGFDRAQSWLESVASSLVHGGLASPYDVLRGFSGTVAGLGAEDLPRRMAQVLADGTGAEWSQVWLVVAGRPTLAATWPPDSTRGANSPDEDPHDTDSPGRRALPVRHEGELLGVLVVQERDAVPLTSIEEKLFEELANQSRLVLRGARLRAELEHRGDELSSRVSELRLSRQRLVDAQDNGRKLLERDIHDGAQQHLLALAVNLRRAQTLAQRSPERADSLLREQEAAGTDAVETLVRLSQGIAPAVLNDQGLAAALEAAAATSPLLVRVDAADLGRFPARTEAAAYFFCLEALQNAAKHADAATVTVVLRGAGGALMAVVEDDGVGFDAQTVTPGAGLANMRDRLASLDGSLRIDSTSRGTRIEASLPAMAEG